MSKRVTCTARRMGAGSGACLISNHAFFCIGISDHYDGVDIGTGTGVGKREGVSQFVGVAPTFSAALRLRSRTHTSTITDLEKDRTLSPIHNLVDPRYVRTVMCRKRCCTTHTGSRYKGFLLYLL